MSIKRIIDTSFWNDAKVIDNYSVEDKFFYLYLMTNPSSSQIGIYSLPKKLICFETGYSIETINVLLDRFQEQYKTIIYCTTHQEITLLNSLKVSILRGGKPVSDLLVREITKVNNTDLIYETYLNMKSFWVKSRRIFDDTIKNIFEEELEKRGKVFNPKQNQNDKQNHIQNHSKKNNDKHNHKHNHNHKQESYPDSHSDSSISQLAAEVIDSDLLYYFEEYTGELPSGADKAWMAHWSDILGASKVSEAILAARNAMAVYPVKYATAILESWRELNPRG